MFPVYFVTHVPGCTVARSEQRLWRAHGMN
jgi:hypothetical protein